MIVIWNCRDLAERLYQVSIDRQDTLTQVFGIERKQLVLVTDRQSRQEGDCRRGHLTIHAQSWSGCEPQILHNKFNLVRLVKHYDTDTLPFLHERVCALQ